MRCDIDLAQLILHELTTNQANDLIKPSFYLKYVLAHETSFVIQKKLKRWCNITFGDRVSQ